MCAGTKFPVVFWPKIEYNRGIQNQEVDCVGPTENHCPCQRHRHHCQRPACRLQGRGWPAFQFHRHCARCGKQPFRRAFLGHHHHRHSDCREEAGQTASLWARTGGVSDRRHYRGHRPLCRRHLAGGVGEEDSPPRNPGLQHGGADYRGRGGGGEAGVEPLRDANRPAGQLRRAGGLGRGRTQRRGDLRRHPARRPALSALENLSGGMAGRGDFAGHPEIRL